MTPPASVSVLIVSFECVSELTDCLASLEPEQEDQQLEVIVVDNASTDGTPEEVRRRFPWVTVIANDENVGFARAANQAMEIAGGDYLLFLNPDTVIPRGAIAATVTELAKHPNVGMLGCRLVRPDGTFDHACKRSFPTITTAFYYFVGLTRLRPDHPRFAHYTAGSLDPWTAGYVDAVNGAFMLVRSEAAAEAGPMDERYWLYAEDLDWCHRFWDTGWKVMYWPEVEVIHVKSASAGHLRPWKINREFYRSIWLFYEKHYSPRYPRLLSGAVWIAVWAKFATSATMNWVRTSRLGGGGG